MQPAHFALAFFHRSGEIRMSLDAATLAMLRSATEQLDRVEQDVRGLRIHLGSLIELSPSTAFVIADAVDLETVERRYVEHTLARLGGNKTQAAEVLRVDPSTLHRKFARWGVSPGANPEQDTRLSRQTSIEEA